MTRSLLIVLALIGLASACTPPELIPPMCATPAGPVPCTPVLPDPEPVAVR